MPNENGSVSDSERIVRDAADAAAGAVGEMSAPPPSQIMLSNGVVLKIKPVPGLLIRRAASQVVKPTVPMWHNPDRGRDEPNPNDPDYLDALGRYDEAVSMAAMNALFIVGTKPETPFPNGVAGPDSEEWIDELKFLEIAAQTEGPGRYLDWLKYVALATTDDLINLSAAVGRVSGLQETDVITALNSFRSGEVRGTDSRPDPEDAGDGDRVQPVAAGSGAGD